MRSYLFLLFCFTVCGISLAAPQYPEWKLLGGSRIPVKHKSKTEDLVGWTNLKNYYGIPLSNSAGAGQTLASVLWGDSGTLEADLALFSANNNLPNCTIANGCLTIAAPLGPCPDLGNGFEQALDILTFHAVAPGAKKLYVCTPDNPSVIGAVPYALENADYVSLSWGTGEWDGQNWWDSYYYYPGTSIFAAAGDSHEVNYPASSPVVIAVGGTTINTNSAGTLSPSGWFAGGGGCSMFSPATNAQIQYSQYPDQGCNGAKSVPDVAMTANPYTGAVINFQNGYYYAGGTSMSAPFMAAYAAINGLLFDSNYVYGGFINFRDVTTGTAGSDTAVVGMDLVTGMGEVIGFYPTYDGAYPNIVNSPTQLNSSQWLQSSNNRFRLSLLGNNQLVVTQAGSSMTVWTTGIFAPTSSLTAKLIMQSDGNLVVIDNTGKVIWYTGTAGKGVGPYSLFLLNDSSLVIFDSTGAEIWSTGTFVVSFPGGGMANSFSAYS